MAVREITDGRLEGDRLGSKELIFTPGLVRPGWYSFDVSSIKASAGSTSLVFQTLMPALAFSHGSTHLRIRGGTHVPLSPSAGYLKDIFLPTVAAMGIDASVESPLLGYYPAGGGELTSVINPAATPLKPLIIAERGRLKRVYVTSAVSNLPVDIAGRQLQRALNRIGSIKGLSPEYGIHTECIKPPAGAGGTGCKGTYLFIVAEFENVRAGFTSLGKRGKPAEKVADEAVDWFNGYFEGGYALDPHLVDQTALYTAIADGESHVSASTITTHLLTNIRVIERFLPVRFDVTGEEGGPGHFSVKGAALAG